MSLKTKIQTAINATSSLCSPTMFELVTQWQKWLAVEKNTAENTCYSYLQDLKSFMEFYLNYNGGGIKPTDITGLTTAHFRAFLTSRIGSGISARSNARAISTLRNFFKYTAKRHGVTNDEINIIKTPRLSTTLPRPMGSEAAIELSSIANYSASDPWQNKRDMTLFLTLYGCGLRISEALGLNINDVVGADHLLVTGKRNKQRMIPLIPLLRQYLDHYISDKPPSIDPDDPLFIGARGERLSPGVAQRAMRRLRTNLGLPDNITPHSLRHSFASHLLQSGADLRSIQELLGHASLTSTQKYTQIDITSLKSNHKAFHPRG